LEASISVACFPFSWRRPPKVVARQPFAGVLSPLLHANYKGRVSTWFLPRASAGLPNLSSFDHPYLPRSPPSTCLDESIVPRYLHASPLSQTPRNHLLDGYLWEPSASGTPLIPGSGTTLGMSFPVQTASTLHEGRPLFRPIQFLFSLRIRYIRSRTVLPQ